VTERPNAKYQYFTIQRDLYRLGPEAYDAMVERTLTNMLDAQGGIGPYVFKREKYNDGKSVVVFAEEEFR
jgi:hypothetical protein